MKHLILTLTAVIGFQGISGFAQERDVPFDLMPTALARKYARDAGYLITRLRTAGTRLDARIVLNLIDDIKAQRRGVVLYSNEIQEELNSTIPLLLNHKKLLSEPYLEL